MQPTSPNLFSIVIPARNEEGCVAATVNHVHEVLLARGIPHEIIVVNDASSDGTWRTLLDLQRTVPTLGTIDNPGPHGFGCAVRLGLDTMHGDAVAIMMADESDSPEDLIRYWDLLCEGHECVFGSRFIKGSSLVDYPLLKLMMNRLLNHIIRLLFGIRLNDTTNAFKAYRREVIDGCLPFLSPHFNLTVELPLKAIVRGYTWTVCPISWKNRRAGISKLSFREMGSRYLFIILYVWLEKFFSRGDYRRRQPQAD